MRNFARESLQRGVSTNQIFQPTLTKSLEQRHKHPNFLFFLIIYINFLFYLSNKINNLPNFTPPTRHANLVPYVNKKLEQARNKWNKPFELSFSYLLT